MNFVRGSLASGEVRLKGVNVPLSEDLRSRLDASPGELTVGLRPESFVADADSVAAGDQPSVRGRVEIVEQLGSESFVYFRTDELEVVDVGERPIELQGAICARIRAGTRLEPGDPLELGIDPANMRLFDGTSGTSVLFEHPRTAA
jgi:ABC-type sugar transport system ATPase subunit